MPEETQRIEFAMELVPDESQHGRLQVRAYCWDQFTADPKRHSEGRGTSVCTFLQSKFGATFLQSGSIDEPDRAQVAQLVGEYESLCITDPTRSNGGDFPVVELRKKLSAETSWSFTIIEGHRDINGGMATDSQGLEVPIVSEGQLTSALQASVLQHQCDDVFVMLTTPKQQSTGVGNTCGAFVAKHTIEFIDTHGMKDHRGQPGGGMVTATLHRSSDLVSDLRSMVRWLMEVHAVNFGTSPPFEIVTASVNWSRTAQLVMQGDNTWEKVMAFNSLLPGMLPGDFIISDFSGSPILQLCAAGMKLFPVHYRKRCMESLQQMGPPYKVQKKYKITFADSMKDIKT